MWFFSFTFEVDFKPTEAKVTLTEIYLPFSDIFEGKSTDGAARNGIVRSGKNAIY